MEQGGSIRATKLVVTANLLLIAAKLIVVVLTGSIAVLAVLVDSLFDLVGSLIAYAGVKKGSEPPDSNHLYGHRKYESVSSIAQVALIAAAAILIIGEALRRLASPIALNITLADLAIMSFTVLVDVGIVTYLKKNADQDSLAIKASIGNYTSDIMQNSLVLVGLFSAMVGFAAADPIAALVVSVLMMRVVFGVGRGAFGELTDESPSQEKLEEYGAEILSVKGVKSFHKMRARMASGEVRLDVHIHLDPQMPLFRSHAITEMVKQAIFKQFPEVKEVLVHAEPATARFMAGPRFGT